MRSPVSATRPRRFRTRLPFRGDVLSMLGAVLLAGFLLVAILGPWLPFGDAEAIDVGPRLAAPTPDLPAGTDSLGRSVLPRLAEGIRTTFVLAGVSVVVTALLSVVLGIIAAYYRGVAGELVTRAADVLFAFPAILLAILIVTIIGAGPTGAVVSIVLITCPLMIRVVRASALGVVHRDFVVASRVGGVRSARILAMHVLPNVAGAAVVQATYALSIGMLVESGLSFLGLGVQPPRASLGSLVHEGSQYLSIAPWLVLVPGALLATAIVAVNLLGDGLRDVLDVRALEVRR